MLDSTIKVSALLALALTTTGMLRSRSAALRHWILVAAVSGALAVPIVTALVPKWDLPFQRALPMQRETSSTRRADAPVATELVASAAPVAFRVGARPTAERVTLAAMVAMLSRLWIAGAGVGLMLLLIGVWRLARVAATAAPLTSAQWRTIAAALARQHGVVRTIRLLAGSNPTLLVTWGYRNPIVLVPASAASWPEDRVRAVLGHEMAHIQRHDWIFLIAAEVLRALYWFNPLVWMVCRRLRQDSEQACDDAVLGGGLEASVYASHLVEIARSFGRQRQSWLPAPAMLRPSSLERRIGAMLNPHLNRRPPTRFARVATIVAALALTVGVAGFQAAAQAFGRVSGSLVDGTSRPIAAATLVITNLANQAKHEVRSDAGGRFDFVGLPHGEYLLEVGAPGFATFREELTVAAQPLQRTVVLQVGSLMETITISGPRVAPQSPRAPVEPPPFDASRCVATATGGNIEQPMKIKDVRPDYPAALYEARAAAHVVLDARIGTDGTIREVRAVAPVQPDFEAAAIEAVRQWRFTQTLLNCVPIDVNMTVHVNFVPTP